VWQAAAAVMVPFARNVDEVSHPLTWPHVVDATCYRCCSVRR
jgi:hypothetical protein